ncbi:MAG: hypothetical protein JWN04_4209 [Myxococcaceae bacterium]|nr:hypothetical protein [Myxococcaceae bacterium]
MTSAARALAPLAPLAPLLPMGGTDPSGDEYLAGIASRATGGVDSKAVREARRCLEWLSYFAAGTPRPRMAALVGIAPKLSVRLSACPWSRIDANVAAALRERVYANVAAGPKQDRRVRGYRGDDGTRRPLEARPRGHGAAQQKVHHLRAVLRAAVVAGRVPVTRYAEVMEALRGA